MAPLGKNDRAGARACSTSNYRDVDLNALTDFYQTARPPAGRPGRGPQRDVVAARPLRRARAGRGDRDVRRRAAALQGPQLPADAAADARDRVPDRRPVQQPHAAGAGARLPATSTYAFDPEAIRFEPSRVFDRRHLRRVRGRDRVRRAIEDAVPRDQPQLAGERSLPGRHHDRVRRADAAPSRSTASASSTA